MGVFKGSGTKSDNRLSSEYRKLNTYLLMKQQQSGNSQASRERK